MPPAPPEADLIHQRRQQHGWSFREAARRASAYTKISEGTWRRYETGAPAIPRDPAKIAAMAAALSVTPAELTAAGREDAAAELGTLMTRVAVQSGMDTAGPGGDGWGALMGEILASFAEINAGPLPEHAKAQLREELIAGLTRDAAERRRHMRAVREITGTGH